ncbi:hypothetical protein [Paenibacillus nuruki]|uniref:hypothetical protein n=1 Tax=Paenibacillus nuruki TaxID=1886670 RepID=UPI00352E4685
MLLEFRLNAAPKPGKYKRVNPTQRQKGDINAKADVALKQRSMGLCELCGQTWAVQRAHLTGRKHIKHKTTEADLAHVCLECHDWLDKDPRGIQARRLIAIIVNHALLELESERKDT